MSIGTEEKSQQLPDIVRYVSSFAFEAHISYLQGPFGNDGVRDSHLHLSPIHKTK